MFKYKYLNQLRNTQARIKTCKENIANIQPPPPYNCPIGKDVKDWFTALFWGQRPSLAGLVETSHTLKHESLDYLRTLGKYMVNVADYYQLEQKYKAEIEQLQKEERLLKEKLDID